MPLRRTIRLLVGVALAELSAGLVAIPMAGVPSTEIRVVQGWIPSHTDTGYLTIVNPTSRSVVVDAVTSPAATTVVLHHGPVIAAANDGRIAHLFCGDPPADPTEGFIAADFDTIPLTVPPRSSLTVAPGHGWLQFSALEPAVWGQRSVPVRLYLDNDGEVTTHLVVR